MPTARQLSFSGGEIAPALHARVDLLKYATGLKTCKNFFIMRHGGASNRAGTQWTCSVKDHTKKVRLIPFIFNNNQTYILEFGNLYMRVIKNGVQLLSGGVPYEIVTPYVEADLPALDFVQSADVITITHPSYAPRDLKRTGDTSWTISVIVFGPSISAPTNFLSDNPGANYSYRITSVSALTGEESLPIVGSAGSVTEVSTLTWTNVSGALYYNLYKLLTGSGTYGWIGLSYGSSFKDNAYVPDILDLAPIDRSLLFYSTGDLPSAVAYYQQRLVFANTNNNPEAVWTSRSALRKNFMISTPGQSDDAVTFSLVGRQVNSIKHMVEAGQLLLFSESGEWTIEGDAAGILTPTGINPKQHSSNGSGSLPPIVSGGSVIYVQARNSVVRDLNFEFETQGYRGNELSIFAAHLFDGYQLKDWAYQQIPHSIIWVVRDDGVLLGMTYIREHQINAWHQHVFDGTVEKVCVVPEGAEDVLYLVVKRNINGVSKRYIERMTTRQVDDIRDIIFLDCSLSYDGRNTGSTTMTLSGGGWEYDDDLTLTASAAFFVSGDVGNEIWLYTSALDVVRCRITAYSSTTVVTVRPHKTVPAPLRGVATTVWSKAVDELSGLGYIEAKQVGVLADGLVLANPNNDSYPVLTVTAGSITLSEPHAVIHVGLPIVADLETLNIDSAQGPSLLDKKKHVNRLTISVEDSRGLWAGVSADRLTELKIRDEENYDDPVALLTGIAQINISGEWNDNGRILIRQTDPLPISVLSIVPSGFIAA